MKHFAEIENKTDNGKLIYELNENTGLKSVVLLTIFPISLVVIFKIRVRNFEKFVFRHQSLYNTYGVINTKWRKIMRVYQI